LKSHTREHFFVIVVTFVKEIGKLAEKNSDAPHDLAATVEAVFGCKWSLRILGLLRQGVNRPGAIERALEGLTPKVQNYYFRRMVGLGILDLSLIHISEPTRLLSIS